MWNDDNLTTRIQIEFQGQVHFLSIHIFLLNQIIIFTYFPELDNIQLAGVMYAVAKWENDS